MERLIYKEEQSFRQSFIPWIMLAVILLMLAVFGFGFYQQLYLGKPYGDDPVSNNWLIWSSILSFILMSAVFIFILKLNLVTEIWSDGIRYKFPPLIRKVKHISLTDISSVEVAKYNPIMEFGGWGIRKRLFARKTAYNIKGRIGIRVVNKNGSQIMFGTQQQEEMKRAIQKMLKQNT